MPARYCASGTFGVSTSANGSTVSISAPTDFGSISGSPFLANMTGSMTTFAGRYWRSLSATAFMHSGEESMPILTASGTMSSNTASICSSIILVLMS